MRQKKAFRGAVIGFSVVIIVLAALQLLGIWKNAMVAYLPLACVNMVLSAISNWKTNRAVAVVSLTAAITVLLCLVVILVTL